MRILVTGGAGFIGSAVCRHLVGERAMSVVNVDCLTYAANLASLADIADSPLYTFVRADIRDRRAIDAILAEYAPAAIVHLAAESHVDRSISAPKDFIETNVVGTYTLLEAARGYLHGGRAANPEAFRFLHVSTDEVYGSAPAEQLFEEATAYDPSSPYAASKAASDHLALAWWRTYRLPVIISNCSNNYGPYHFPEKLIPLTIISALEGKPLRVYGDGSNVRDWLHVEDHARALASVLSKGKPGEKYNIGARSERTNIEVVRQICSIMDRLVPAQAPHERLISFVTDRPGHDFRYAIDPTKIENELDWQASERFEAGLEKTVRWYLARRDWWEPLRAKTYSGERLGLIDTLVGK